MKSIQQQARKVKAGGAPVTKYFLIASKDESVVDFEPKIILAPDFGKFIATFQTPKNQTS